MVAENQMNALHYTIMVILQSVDGGHGYHPLVLIQTVFIKLTENIIESSSFCLRMYFLRKHPCN